MAEQLRHVIVVVPARDEAETLRACMQSIERARRAIDGVVQVHTVLVLDTCTDNSASVAGEFGDTTVLSVRFANVGKSRARGVAYGLRRIGDDPAAVWIATTDADSVVADGWLREHVRAFRSGADAFVGSVVPLLDDLDESRRRAWLASHSPGSTLGHVHGANLGIRADAYLAAGGFTARKREEDVSLVHKLRRTNARIMHSEREPVTTSSRLVGRVEGGYAQYLTDLVPRG
ncbi:MAG: glycosyltransferase [Lacisediminihabitans sp.]